jgi:hypothetical protein
MKNVCCTALHWSPELGVLQFAAADVIVNHGMQLLTCRLWYDYDRCALC